MLECPIDAIGASACSMVALSGFYESRKPPPLGEARSIVPPHRDGHQNGQQSGYMLQYRCVDCCPGGCRGDTERVITRWQRPVASCEALSPGHVVLGDALRIASAHRHGHQNFPQRRCICSPPPPFLTDVMVAKDHGMVH